MISSTGGSLIYKSSISWLFRIFFNEEVIASFSIFSVISFLVLLLTLNPEFPKSLASFSRQIIKISLTRDNFLSNFASFPSYEIEPL